MNFPVTRGEHLEWFLINGLFWMSLFFGGGGGGFLSSYPTGYPIKRRNLHSKYANRMGLHPWTPTWKIKITHLKRKIIWTKPPFFGFQLPLPKKLHISLEKLTVGSDDSEFHFKMVLLFSGIKSLESSGGIKSNCPKPWSWPLEQINLTLRLHLSAICSLLGRAEFFLFFWKEFQVMLNLLVWDHLWFGDPRIPLWVRDNLFGGYPLIKSQTNRSWVDVFFLWFFEAWILYQEESAKRSTTIFGRILLLELFFKHRRLANPRIWSVKITCREKNLDMSSLGIRKDLKLEVFTS